MYSVRNAQVTVIKHHCMKVYREVAVWLHAFVTSVLHTLEKEAPHPFGSVAPVDWIEKSVLLAVELFGSPGVQLVA
jgi:hypothetical protein